MPSPPPLPLDALQRALGVPVTGELDAATRAAVRAFQRGHGSLMITGRLDPRTIEALRALPGLAPAPAPAEGPQNGAGP